MHTALPREHWAFISTAPAVRREIRPSVIAVLASVIVFAAVAPFAKMPLAQVPAFIPAYVAALVVCDLITAAILFGQFSVLRSPALLVLAGGYFFTATSTLAYALIFPDLFLLPGLPKAGPQTSSAMYMFWHSGFPLAVIAYARLKHKAPQGAMHGKLQRRSPHVAVGATVGAVLALVCGFTAFALWGQAYIPVFLHGNQTSDLGRLVLLGIWLLSVLALAVLWRSRPHTVLDVWLLVVLCVWLFDIALAALLNSGRYDLGWYMGRLYGLLAASALLVVLMLETVRQYARLVQVSVALSAANQALAQVSRQDGLTGLANRRHFDEYLGEQLALARRHQRALALIMFDVDHFKAYNDGYGHQDGDACLKQVAGALQSCCQRPADLVARYGGEEFAMVLPDTDLAGAARVADAARAALARLNLRHGHSPTAAHVSLSAGVAELPAQGGMTAHQLIASADQALYQAKKGGRDRVVCAGN